MSWQEPRTPISKSIGKLTSGKIQNTGEERDLTALPIRLSHLQVNILQDEKNSSVNSVIISSRNQEVLANVTVVLKQNNIKILNKGQYWICVDAIAVRILRAISQ